MGTSRVTDPPRVASQTKGPFAPVFSAEVHLFFRRSLRQILTQIQNTFRTWADAFIQEPFTQITKRIAFIQLNIFQAINSINKCCPFYRFAPARASLTGLCDLGSAIRWPGAVGHLKWWSGIWTTTQFWLCTLLHWIWNETEYEVKVLTFSFTLWTFTSILAEPCRNSSPFYTGSVHFYTLYFFLKSVALSSECVLLRAGENRTKGVKTNVKA